MIKQLDSQRFITGNRDAQIYAYNIRTFQLLQTLTGHSNQLVSFELLLNGLLMSISSSEIIWWNTTSYTQVHIFNANKFDPTSSLSRVRQLDSDGSMLVGFAYYGTLYKYRLYLNGSVEKLVTWQDVNLGWDLFETLVIGSMIVFNSWDHVRLINKSNDVFVYDFSTRVDFDNIKSLEIIQSRSQKISYKIVPFNTFY